MSSVRERKAVAAFAAAQQDAAAAPASTTDTNATANAALARAAAGSSASSASGASSGKSIFRFLPYIVLFLLVFLAVSFATTGTLNYGLDSPAAMKAFTKQVDAMKIRVQEFAGLREPAPVARPANTGYGGVTPKKKKAKKKKAAANPATGGGAPGISPEMMGMGGGDDAAPGDDEEEDKPKPVVITPRPLEHDFGALYLSVEELAKYDGSDGGPIFLAIYGRLFDVTEGRNFYAKGASYSGFGARDASRAFATNCFNSKNLWDLRGITAEQRKSIDHWYNFYNTHERYTAIGWVNLPEIDEDEPLPDDLCEETATTTA